MASTSSSVTTSPLLTQRWAYDVFLSFADLDNHNTFVDYLYSWLEVKGISTFEDDHRLEKGDCISTSVQKVIQESRFFITVFSKDYASSRWCLEELAAIMECQEKFKDQIVVPIFYDVEPSDVQNLKGSFEDSFKELEKFKDDELKVRRWKEALKKAGYLKGHHLQNDYYGQGAKCAEGVAADILARLNQSNQASSAFEENLVGLESRVNIIGTWLRLVSDDDDDDDARFIGIYGMGGLGKTTTAKAVFNKFSHQFDGACFLADVGQYNIIELQKALLTTILKKKLPVEISNVEDGMVKIRTRLKWKRVLIVLDDVDDTEQLEKLSGGGDWFGRGSRVIITTRDAAVLRSHGVDKKYIHEVQTLEEQEAIQLFSLHAFKKKIPKTGFEALCGSIVRHAMGLPLALKVLGSHLYGLNAVNWETISVKLKEANSQRTLEDEILALLRISFDGLNPENKKIFLDIACFFRHEREEYVKDVLKSCDLPGVDSAMHNLTEKSLISVLDDGRIQMHDLIREMGLHIAREEKARSRLWQLEEVDGVLSGEMNPKHIEGIGWLEKYSRASNRTFGITLRGMINLKMLRVGYDMISPEGRNNVFHLMDNYLPSNLRWLEFQFYHFTSLPQSLASSKLVGLSLRYSSLQNCRITQILDNLTALDLSSSYSLVETPDFNWMPNLMKLDFRGCNNLTTIHSSIGNLSKLVLLDLSNCSRLMELPSFNQVSSLELLNLDFCEKLKFFPEIKTITPHLVHLDLKEVGIIELPSSIQQLHGLTKLRLEGCENLECLSNDLCELKYLKILKIKNCKNLKSLPENLEGLISLEYLNLQGSHFDSLPKSFSQLTSLQYLDLTQGCEYLDKLPKLPANIGELYADCRFKIAKLAIECSKLYSVSYSYDNELEPDLPKEFIHHHFPLHRETPLCVSYPIKEHDYNDSEMNKLLRTFKYRHYQSNGISIHLKSPWYSQNFVGFVVCFLDLKDNIWEPHSYQDIDDSMSHCTIVAKLSHNDSEGEVFLKGCVVDEVSGESDDVRGHICFAFIPFRSLWGESKGIMDYSRFEVQFMNLKASADWGCSLLYERQTGAGGHISKHDEGDSGLMTDDIACLTSLELEMTKYLNLSGRDITCLPNLNSQLPHLRYLDISSCERLIMLPKLPPTIRELYAHSNLASESNIAKLATKYSELYSVSFSHGDVTLSAEELARKHFQARNFPLLVTYKPYLGYDDLTVIDTKRWFKYPSYHSNKISINLNPSWYSQAFVGFVVCFLLKGREHKWESQPDIRPFRYCKVIAKLIHKDNANEGLQTNCVIGRLYDEEFDPGEDEFICFAYIPFCSLSSVNPNDYSVFEVAFLDSNTSSDWSCDLVYINDESLSEAVKSNASLNDNDSEEIYGLISSTTSVIASPTTQGWTYDVFLSFRGSDTSTFVGYLYSQLEQKEICAFKDDNWLKKGDCINLSLQNPIQESRIFITVFSKGYASSKWCLEELATIMECQEKFKEQVVVPIFYDVEPSDVRNQKGSFGDSFKELEKIVEDDEAKLRRWREALKNAGDIKGHHLQDDYNGYEAKCAEVVAVDILARLNLSNQALPAFEENLVGLESRVNNIGNWLRLASNDGDTRFIGICGMGGIGKTTIAMAVFNKIWSQFDGACFLTNIRQHNTIELQKTLITTISKDKSGVEISNVQDGMAKTRIMLQEKKVLIVLDDVDDTEQLEKLAGGGDSFGRGSRVIITTRDAGILRSHGIDKKYIYEVQTLEEQEAIQLFSWFAFKKKVPKTGFKALCGSIVHYAKGLPLALKVLGSSLCELEVAEWESTLEELKVTPNDDIDTKLKICFDRLDSKNKKIFLYIACFFRHEREEYVKDVLKSCDLQPVIGMRVLIEKSLISVLEGRIEMHDLIQEMGWHIASLEKPRSRVWQLKDVDDVLCGKMDPIHKEGILLPSAGDISEENISELKWLDFKFYPFTSLRESFIPSKLVWFSLHHSCLKNCRINQKLDNLIYLDLNSSYSLLETPDFDWMPNLMRLNLSDCQKLRKIHPSVGNLRKLILFDLSKCHDLERLPSLNQVSSLRSLNLVGCIRLENFPKINARIPHLVELDLKMVGIEELSSSMQKLHGLTKLCLDQCPHLVRLCNGLCELKSLKVLEIKNCKNLKSLPENLEGLISLEYLNFQGCCFDSLPKSFGQLTCLQYLIITDCEIPNKVPKLPANIKELYVDCGFKIAELAIQYSKLKLVSFSLGHQHGVITSLAKKFINFPLHRKTPFCVSYRITSVDLEKSKMLTTFKYRHYKSNGICINLDSSWYSKKFMGFAVCFSEKKGNIWGRHSYQAIDNCIRYCTVLVKLTHKDNKDEVLQTACVIAVSSFDNSDIYGTICCAYIPVSSLLGGESKALKDYSRFEVQFMNVEASADWGCSLLYERQIGATKHKDNHDGTDSEHKTDDIGCLSSLGLGTEYLNLNRRDLICLPKLTHLQYLDISGSRRLIVLPKLPTTIKELYAHSNLASESNIAKLSIMYPELYSVSFSYGYATVSAEELARKFVRVPFQIRNSPFVVTYPACDDLADIDTKRWFKYTSHCSNEVSINLKSSWYNEIFMGFVVCFLLQGRPQGWESHPDILPFRHYKVIAKLIHKDNANEFLQTDCVIGRLYDEEFDDEFEDCQFICFAYIPSSSLLSKYEGDPNDYSVFKVAFLDSSNSSDWSCGLLYENDELLSEAVRSNIYTDTLKSQQLDPHITKSWQLTKIVHQYQCQMVSMPECFDAKVVRLLYTKFGVGIMALGVDGILKLWKWPHNKQNPSAKATVNFVPQYWQTNSGLLIDVSGVNIKEVFPCIALSNDGYFVALAIGGKVSLFNMNTIRFKEMTTFKLPSASTCLAHDPCAYETIAIGAEDSTIYLYNFAKEKVMTELKGHHDRITGLAFSTNPYMLVSSGADAQLCVWNNIGSWRKRISVRIQLPGEVFSGDTQVMFHVDQLHLLVTHETQLAIYDTSMMECISQWIPHGSLSTPISSATYSSNSLLVYASFNDGNIGVFDAHSLRLRCCIAPSAYLSQIVPDRIRGVYPVAIAAHPQKTNQFAIGLTNGSVKVIEPREFERKWGVSLTIDNDPIQCRMVSMPECFDAKVKVAQILYTKSGVDILALSSNGFYKLWKWFHHEQNPSRKATANSLPQHWQTYSGLHVSVVNLVEVVPCIALSNDGSFVALAAGEKVSLFDMETFEEKVTFICQSASTFLAFHPRHNNILAIGMEDSTINIYNAWDKEVMVNLKGAQKRITGLAFSTNLEMLVSSGADARLCAWSIDTWEMRISVPIQLPASELEVPSRDTHVMFHADQLHLLVTHETQLAIYDASKMECISQWIPHDCLCAPISSATYSCNNQLVYASFKDGNIGVLDFDKPNSLRLRCRIAPFAYLSKVNSDGVYAVVIAAHPQEPYQLAIGLTDGSVKVIEPLESEGEWRISPPVDIETLNEDEDDESDEDVEEYEAKESNAGNSVELAAEYNDSERIDDDEEASITEKSVKDAALFGEIHEPNPIIWKDHNYHIEEDHETTTSQHELGPNKIKQWEFTAIVDRDQCRMVSMSDCFDAKVVRLFYTNSGVSILALSSDGIQKLWKWLNNEQNPTGKATANYVPQNWQSNSGLLMINDVVGVDLENVVPCIALSNDDSYIVSSVGGKVSLFNIMTFEVTKTITLPSASTFLAFDPHDDNIIAIGTEKSTIYIYDRIDEELNELGEHHKPITGLAFSTNLKLLVSSDADAQLCSWNTRLWRKKRSVRIQLPAGEVCSGDTHVMFHVDQLHLLVTHETQLAIYDASKMERINQWIPNGSFSAPISCATYSCNCQLIYATLKDGNIGVFDAHGLRPRCCIAPCAYLSQVILNRSESVYAVAIAAHPQYPNQFAIGLTDGSVKVIEPLESQRQWGISPPVDIEILNAAEKSVLTQLELGTGEAEQIKPNPANEDCEAKVHSNKCALIRCFWKCC